jgi:hypothetical protein
LFEWWVESRACYIQQLRTVYNTAPVQTAGDVAGIRITIPDITAEASPGAEYTYTWSLDEIRSHLLVAFRDHTDPSGAFKPNASTLAALDAATRVCDVAQRKGMIPSLFLTVAIFASALFGPESERPFLGLDVLIHKATLPIAAGLGSSAAFSVATAAALLDMFHKTRLETKGLHSLHDSTHSAATGEFVMPPPRALQLINDWAYSAEMLFHGAPSGLDNTVSTYGRLVSVAFLLSMVCPTWFVQVWRSYSLLEVAADSIRVDSTCGWNATAANYDHQHKSKPALRPSATLLNDAADSLLPCAGSERDQQAGCGRTGTTR